MLLRISTSNTAQAATPARLSERSVRALVCDSNAASRIGLGVLLRRQRWVGRCLLAGDRDQAVALGQRFKPDVAIVDISTVGPFVASYIAPLRAARPAMAILLSTRCEHSVPATLAATGATGLLSPGFTIDELVQAVRSAVVGDERPRPRQLDQESNLSHRQREVLALMSTGATNREIAAVMHVEPETVKKHAQAVFHKLGVRNRTEAAQRAAHLLDDGLSLAGPPASEAVSGYEA